MTVQGQNIYAFHKIRAELRIENLLHEIAKTLQVLEGLFSHLSHILCSTDTWNAPTQLPRASIENLAKSCHDIIFGIFRLHLDNKKLLFLWVNKYLHITSPAFVVFPCVLLGPWFQASCQNGTCWHCSLCQPGPSSPPRLPWRMR